MKADEPVNTNTLPADISLNMKHCVCSSTNCLNNNLDSIIMANDICNRYGLDTISAGPAYGHRTL